MIHATGTPSTTTSRNTTCWCTPTYRRLTWPLEGARRLSQSGAVKGIGELAVCGAAAANAIFNATSVWVSDYPATLDKVMTGLD